MSERQTLGPGLARGARVYVVAYALLLVCGLSGIYNPLWAHIVIVAMDGFVAFAEPALRASLVAGPLLLAALLVLLLVPRTRRPVARWGALGLGVVLLAAIAAWAHLLTAVAGVAAPRTAAAVVLVAFVSVALLRVLWPRLGRVGLWPRALGLLLLSALVCLSAFANFADRRGWWRPADADAATDVRLLQTFQSPYDVVVLGASGKLAVLEGGQRGYAVERIDAQDGARDGRVAFPPTARPHGAYYDARSERLFVAGYNVDGLPNPPGVAVIAAGRFELERWLPLPGCLKPINVDASPDGASLVAVCETNRSLYVFDRATLAGPRIAAMSADWFYAAYDLEFAADTLLVTTPPFPFLYRRTPGLDRDGTDPILAAQRLSSMPYGIVHDPRARRTWIPLPLERRIAGFAAGQTEAASWLHTEGLVRDVAVDPSSGRLFAGSYFRGVIEQFDTRSGRRLGRWRVHPLLRGLAWDGRTGMLFTASSGGVHRIEPR